MTRNNLDLVDRKILAALQGDARLTLPKIADSAGLTSTACWRRIQKLEEEGIIGARVTLLSAERLGFGLTGYVMIRTRNHSDDWAKDFIATLTSLPAIIEIHRTTGSVDYLLKIVALDMAAYNELYRTIARHPDLADVSAAFSMEAIKATTELPLCLLSR